MNVLERFVNPSKHVLEPYGSIAKNGEQYFIQVSKEEGVANWITLGELLVSRFGGSNLTDDFIKECLQSYNSKNSSLELNLKELR